jgi:hypothetical protein
MTGAVIRSILRLDPDANLAGRERGQAKPELGIQFGAGGSTSAEELAAEGTKDVASIRPF